MVIGVHISHLRLCLAAGLIAAVLSGCKTVDDETPAAAGMPVDLSVKAAAEPPEFVDLLPTEAYRRGLQHFERGEYGLAERYLRAAVETAPNNAGAWIALAASYDHIRRFDLADRAYGFAIRLNGATPQILNNQGYSYMSRGDFNTARAKFAEANRRDPNNPVILNNLALLKKERVTSYRH